MFRLSLSLVLALASTTASLAQAPYYRHSLPAIGTGGGAPSAGTNAPGGTGQALAASPPAITSLRSGSTVSSPLNITGGLAPYSYTASGLPSGVQLVDGALKGSSSTPGDYQVEATVTDSSSPQQVKALSFRISVVQPMTVASASVKARAGMAITPYAFTALNPSGTVAWSMPDGSAFQGQLAIDPASGVVSGKLAANAAKGSATVVATDAAGPAEATLAIDIVPAPVARSKAPADAYVPKVGIAFTSEKPEVDNLVGAAPKSWALVSSGVEVPKDQVATKIGAWAQFDEKTGVLTGTPTAVQAKITPLLLRVTDTDGVTADTTAFSLEVKQPTANMMSWGWNPNGGLSVGDTSDRSAPTAAGAGYAFSKVKGYNNSACGIAFSGVTYCWGFGRSGNLGNGSSSDSVNPVPVSGGHRFSDIATGAWVNCGLRTDGAILCWGGSAGSTTIGNGTTDAYNTPQVIGTGFVTLHQGFFVHCGTKTDGRTYCWGANFSGQLGDGTTTERFVPTPIAGSHAFVKVVGGYSTQCGLRSDGVALCWGTNNQALLGNGTTTGSSLVPTPVTNGTGMSDLVMGAYHACGLKASGWVCWGKNTYGQLGDGTTQSQATPVPGMYGVRYSQIALQAEATCGLGDGGALLCWGLNYYGGLGKGNTAASTVPTRVLGGASYGSISPGFHHMYGLLNQ